MDNAESKTKTNNSPRNFTMRQASNEDAATVSSVLSEAAQWLQDRGIPLWKTGELLPERIRDDVRAGLYWLALVHGEPAGCLRFQDDDPLFWPEAIPGTSAFIHRLAVRRKFAGQGVSSAMLAWAKDRAAAQGCKLLRLDCVADRPKLRAIYERNGFRFHSYRQIGPYYVARYEIEVGTGSSMPPANTLA